MIARYKEEPTLRDVYVEGQFDASVLKDYLLAQDGCDDVVVYEIDTVDVTATMLIENDLDGGQKGRVIAACLAFSAALGDTPQVTGIVDRDYDNVRNIRYECPLLLFTDYACMEMYSFTEPVLGRFFRLFVRRTEFTPSRFIAAVRMVLIEAFLMRAANQEKGYALKWLEVEEQCKVTLDKAEFDVADFVQKYLNKSAKLKHRDEFNFQLELFRASIAGQDERHCINGHDFVGMLAKYILKSVSNKNLADTDVVERQLVAHLDFKALASEPMFLELLNRVRR